MANCCRVTICVHFDSEKFSQASFKGFVRALDFEMEKCNDNYNGCFIGSDTKYLFDGEFVKSYDNEIIVLGWTKWNFTQDDFIHVFKYLSSYVNNSITYMSVEYCELNGELYGKIIYDGKLENMAYDEYLDEDYFPNIQTDDIIKFENMVKENFNKYANKSFFALR